MAIKAEKAGSISKLKKGLKRGGGNYLARVPQDGITVRFQEEPDQWIKFYEHYSKEHEPHYFPCDSDNCEGCDEGMDVSKRYIVNAVDVDESKSIPLVLPSSLVSNLMKKYDRFHTILDRDYELSKEGTMMDTEYDAIYDQPRSMKMGKYQTVDLLALLQSQLDSDDEDDDDDEEEARPRKKVKKVVKPPARRRKVVDEDDDDDEPPRRTKPGMKKRVPVKTAVSKKRVVKKPIRKTLSK